MDGQELVDENFDAKPAGDELPDPSWGLDRLGDYLRAEHDAMVQCKRQSALAVGGSGIRSIMTITAGS